MAYTIDYSIGAVEDIEYFKKYERGIIIQGIEQQLTYEPLREVRNRKRIDENTLNAGWELRIGVYRVFYNVDEPSAIVMILAGRWKEHNTLYIQGRKYKL